MLIGVPEFNDAWPLVFDYAEKQSLSEIGIKFDYDSLSDFEADYLKLIHLEVKKYHREKAEKKNQVTKSGWK